MSRISIKTKADLPQELWPLWEKMQSYGAFENQAGVMAHVKQAIASDRFELLVLPGASEPSKVAPTSSASYRLIERTVRELFTGTVVAPGLMVGVTDSRHFEGVSDHIYKFSPVRAKPEDLARFHGTNERITLATRAMPSGIAPLH